MRRVKRKRPRPERRTEDRERSRYRDRYEKLKAKLRGLGYVCLGSITRRWLTCGKPSCICHRDPSRRHGPYYHWTRKVRGRTQSRMLDERLARLYEEGIRNHRSLDALVEKMREVSLLAFQAAKMASNR